MEGIRNVTEKYKGIASIIYLLAVPYFLLFLSCQSQTMSTQSTKKSITGIIKNSEGKPLEDAIITITQGSSEFPDIASVSDSNGNFSLQIVQVPGTYTIQANYQGNAKQKTFVLDSSSASIAFVF
jgi:hypothetical protein